jgi:outer membrane protein
LKADTLIISLKAAYTNNSKLNAERASVRATYQDTNLAISEFMPNITVSGYASEQDNTSDHGADSNFYPTEQSLLFEQKIFDGFGGVAK